MTVVFRRCLSAAAAYEEMYHTVYQLIISDIMMPETGLSLRDSSPINETIPILFMSAKMICLQAGKGFQLDRRLYGKADRTG